MWSLHWIGVLACVVAEAVAQGSSVSARWEDLLSRAAAQHEIVCSRGVVSHQHTWDHDGRVYSSTYREAQLRPPAEMWVRRTLPSGSVSQTSQEWRDSSVEIPVADSGLPIIDMFDGAVVREFVVRRSGIVHCAVNREPGRTFRGMMVGTLVLWCEQWMPSALHNMVCVGAEGAVLFARDVSRRSNVVHAIELDSDGWVERITLFQGADDWEDGALSMGSLKECRRLLSVWRTHYVMVEGVRMPSRCEYSAHYPDMKKAVGGGVDIVYEARTQWVAEGEVPHEFKERVVQVVDRWALDASGQAGDGEWGDSVAQSNAGVSPWWWGAGLAVLVVLVVRVLKSMRTKNVRAASGVLLLGCLTIVGCGGGGSGAVLSAKQARLEKSVRGLGAKEEWKFELCNKGSQSLDLRVAAKSCVCFDVAWSSECVHPGESVRLTVTSAGGGAVKEGDRIEGGLVVVGSVDGVDIATVALAFRGEVKRTMGLTLLPSRIVVGQGGARKEQCDYEITLVYGAQVDDGRREPVVEVSGGAVMDGVSWVRKADGGWVGRSRVRVVDASASVLDVAVTLGGECSRGKILVER